MWKIKQDNKKTKEISFPESSFEAKIKALDYMQSIISRLSGYSFQCKNWYLTISFSSIFILYFQEKLISIEYSSILKIQLIMAFSFWLLNSYYLFLEREMRKVFYILSNQPLGEKNFFDSMKQSQVSLCDKFCFFLKAFFSPSVILIYVFIGMGVNFIIYFFLIYKIQG